MVGFDYKNLGLVMVLSLVMVTMLSWMLSQYTDFPVLKSGGAFVLLFISVFIIYIFVAVSDKKIDRGEIITMFMVAISLLISGILLKKFMPEIFSIFPTATKNIFSAFA